ncbi:hypothetical protein UFB30_04035 [Jeotgalibacillus sp. HH7-29]|uniref:Uncharacterized protein n=1 Tax=Jeotgalibacillus haloalkalitolerans TaxID=3104292 RepID=A0ABU5KJN2_9BACL|nr:hypothetical protein [Jeotgalibacillus sp. HH7-29]
MLGACEEEEKTPISTAEHEFRVINFGLDKANVPKTELYPIEPYAASADTNVYGDEALLNIEEYYGTPFYMGGTATLSDDFSGYGKGRTGVDFALEVVSHTQETSATFYLDRDTYAELYNDLLKSDAELFLTGVIPDPNDEMDFSPTGFVTDIEVIKLLPEESYLPSEDLQAFMDEMGLSTTEREVRYNPYAYSGRYFAYEGVGQMLPQTGYSPDVVDPADYFQIDVVHRTAAGLEAWTLFFEREKFQGLYEAAKTGFVQLNAVNLYDSDLNSRYSRTRAYVREAEYSVIEPLFSTITEEGKQYMEQQGVELTDKDVLYDPYSYIDMPFFMESKAELVLGDENADTFEIQLPSDPYYKTDPFADWNHDQAYSYQIDYKTFTVSKTKYAELYALLKEQDVDVRVIAEIDQEMLEDDTSLVGRVIEVEW